MSLRTIILALAGVGIPFALAVAILPITWGYGGYIERANGVFTFVDPAGPAARAVHVGERALRPRGVEAVEEDAGNVGTVARFPVVTQSGRVRNVSVTFVPFSGALAVQEQLDKVLSALTALGAFVVAMLVVLKGRDKRAGERAASVLLLAGLAAFLRGAGLVCGNAWIALFCYWVVPRMFVGTIVWVALNLLAIYPPTQSRLRSLLGRLSAVALVWAVLFGTAWLYDMWNGTSVFLVLDTGGAWVELLLLVALGAAIVDGMASAGPAYTTPMRWLGGMWLIAIALAASLSVASIAGVETNSHDADLLRAVVVFCLAFGVAYPVLRHRLIDLNILVSRATVFTIASAIIVGLFIAAEWAISKIFERSLGLSSERGSLAAQLVTLVVVLVLGISARSIHRFVEDRMTKTFFKKRMRGLAEIERVAHEADAATDARAVIDIAVGAVQRGLEPLGTALYLHKGDGYERASSAGAFVFPSSYAFNDEPPLRLRRWQEPFELDDDSDDRHHILFVPMTLRGEVLGFVCCGPKPDRTAYLSDEIAAVSLLAHHVGIASAMLSRAPELKSVVALAAT
jgi:hypothetical protein